MGAVDWHHRQLTDPAVTGARRAYHEAMVRHIIDPSRAAQPLVSIVIPVYNRAALLVESVRSCMAQSWRPIEILVVDDGSDDDPASALRAFGDAVHLLRKPNGGVSSARNFGIARARGAFIQFLDSDDMLLPDAIERGVAAFRAVPDADLCFGLTSDWKPPGVHAPSIRKPDGGPLCPTSSLLNTVLRRHPFFISTVMMPRWKVLATGPFEEDLGRGEDTRFYFRLGLAGAKVIGYDEPLGIRRLVEDGLSITPHLGRQAADVRIRIIRDLIRTPAAWPRVGPRLQFLLRRMNEDAAVSVDEVRGLAAFNQILVDIGALADGRYRDGWSPVPLLADIRGALAHSDAFGTARWSDLWHALDEAAGSALRSAAPVGERDVGHWRDALTYAPIPTPVMRFCEAVMEQLTKAPDLMRHVDPVLRRLHPAPAPASVRRYRRLRRWFISARLAAWLTWPSAYRRSTR